MEDGLVAVTLIDAPRLGFGFTFADIATRDGLIRLDRRFLEALAGQEPELHERLLAARAAPDAATTRESDLVVALGAHLDSFVSELFGIAAETGALARETARLDPIHACKRLFVQRQAVKKYADPSGFDGAGAAGGAGSPDGRTADRGGVLPAMSRNGKPTRRRWIWRCGMRPGRP